MQESLWYQKLEKTAIEQNDLLYKNDFKFFQVDTFLKVAQKIDRFSDECPVCKESKQISEELAENLFEYLKGDVKSRKAFEKKINAMHDHVRKAHNIYPPFYFTSFYSLLGVVFGLLAGALIAYLTIPGFIKQSLLFGFVIGLVIGRILGRIKDNRQAKAGLVL
ncbi:MAG: hypothetical protein L3J74_02030 [Bacteroidales bacterium]|nr:hypothetical protein [Bacteroidales bacterium]